MLKGSHAHTVWDVHIQTHIHMQGHTCPSPCSHLGPGCTRAPAPPEAAMCVSACAQTHFPLSWATRKLSHDPPPPYPLSSPSFPPFPLFLHVVLPSPLFPSSFLPPSFSLPSSPLPLPTGHVPSKPLLRGKPRTSSQCSIWTRESPLRATASPKAEMRTRGLALA